MGFAAARPPNTLFIAQGQISIILYGEVIIHLSLLTAREPINDLPLYLVPTVNRL